MLDRKHVVIAHEAQVGNEIFPVLVAVAVAHGAEYPRTVYLVGIVFGVEHAVDTGIDSVDLGVLGVYVIDRFSQISYLRRSSVSGL